MTMEPVEVCAGAAFVSYSPLIIAGLMLVLMAIGALMRARGWQGPRRVKGSLAPIPVLIALVLGVGVMMYWRSTVNEGFYAYALSANGLSLRYFYPKAAVEMQGRAIDAISVVRGRHFGKNGQDDRWHLRVQSGGATYRSCETGLSDKVLVSGRAIATALEKHLQWRLRCPDGTTVPADEAAVTAPGKMSPPGTCASSP
jgi:hypothetical protein